MHPSIWSDTLAAFRDKAEGSDPVPAGVALSAVSASLALALVAKVLEITGRKKGFDPVSGLLEAAKQESSHLAHLADEDIGAFDRYMDCVRKKEPRDEAMREAIRVPMSAARSITRGLRLCHEAAGLCSTGLTAADLGSAASLLSGALRAMMLSVEANLTQLPPGDPFHASTAEELTALRRFSSS